MQMRLHAVYFIGAVLLGARGSFDKIVEKDVKSTLKTTVPHAPR